MTSSTSSLDTPVQELRATSTTRLSYQDNVLLRSFLLERPADTPSKQGCLARHDHYARQ